MLLLSHTAAFILGVLFLAQFKTPTSPIDHFANLATQYPGQLVYFTIRHSGASNSHLKEGYYSIEYKGQQNEK
jgi:hypothetical protein